MEPSLKQSLQNASYEARRKASLAYEPVCASTSRLSVLSGLPEATQGRLKATQGRARRRDLVDGPLPLLLLLTPTRASTSPSHDTAHG